MTRLLLTSLCVLAVLLPATSAHAAALPPPANVRVEAVGSGAATLRWRAVAGATGYDVWRDGRHRATVSGTRFVDRNLGVVAFHSWTIRTRLGRQTFAESRIAAATTRHSAACTLHASSLGSDAGSGSSAAPLRTVRTLVQRLGAGDVGCLHGSFREDVTIDHGGSAGSPLVLRSAPGTRARLTGRLWVSNQANHVVIAELTLDGRNMTGDDLPSPTINGDHIRLVRNDITNRNTAICVILGSIHGYGRANHVVLDSNRIHNCGKRPAANHHHGIYLENSYNTKVSNNVIYANADRGIQLYPNAQRSLIVRNVIDGNGQGVIFSGNEGYASSGNRVLDNVITHARLRYNIEYWWPEGNPIGRRNLAARNCVWAGAQGNIADDPVGLTVRDNRVADPRYRSRRTGDFRPRANSGCRDLLLGALPLSGL